MKRKIVVLLLALSFIIIAIVVCWNKTENTADAVEVNTEVTEQTEQIETTENSTETTKNDETDNSFNSGYTINEDGSYSYDGSKDTSDSYDKEIWEGEDWVMTEGYRLAGCESMSEFVDTYAPGQGYGEAWRAYAQQNGADTTDGACWIYYHGKAAGNEPSYAINKMTGEKIVSGPHAMLPGGLNFWGCGAEYEANFDAYLNSL